MEIVPGHNISIINVGNEAQGQDGDRPQKLTDGLADIIHVGCE